MGKADRLHENFNMVEINCNSDMGAVGIQGECQWQPTEQVRGCRKGGSGRVEGLGTFKAEQ